MGSIASVSQEGTAYLIRQAYEAGEKWQWAREALVNGIQAKATSIEFGVEPQGFKSKGVLRRYIADNGIGMSPEDIKIFLMSFGGGGRPIGLTQNFGQGFKSSCYEWNPYGIIVASWTKDDPEGCMIWIHRVTRAGKIYWELKDFEVDEDGSVEDVVAPLYLDKIGVDVAQLKTKEIEEAGHGTVFLFLGKSPDDDTHRGDVDRGEDNVKRGIIIYINSRFLEIPQGVTVGSPRSRIGRGVSRALGRRTRWSRRPERCSLSTGVVLAGRWPTSPTPPNEADSSSSTTPGSTGTSPEKTSSPVDRRTDLLPRTSASPTRMNRTNGRRPCGTTARSDSSRNSGTGCGSS
ncbi:hypothetical protein [Nocardia fluminea]|uniref:hypothetical protein n=1 Tax=Nocardia fluminea TaxID=134984 RepID=UPI003D14518F